jgi:large subunit ribosomal protein L25
MEAIQLSATKRAVRGKQVGQLRRAGHLPGVLYGPGVEPLPIQLDGREAARVLRKVHGAQLIDLTVDGQTRKVLVHDLQRDAIRGDYLHADFYAVDMSRPIRVRIPVTLVGASYAVNSLSGVLVRGLQELEIECLPADLIVSVEADLSELKEIGNALYVKNLYTPKTVKVLSDPDEMIVRVTYQAKEEDLSAPVEAVSAEVEVIEKGKIEEEGEEAEGEAAKAAPAKAAPAAKAPAPKK